MNWLKQRPALRDALLWAVPAILFGAFLRILLLSYSPYAHWGSDSSSYYDFAERLLLDGEIKMKEKRQYVYPLLMVIPGALPGSSLRNVALLQHAFGVLTLIPLAYAARKIFVHWRWLVIPLTLIYAAMPIVIWEEHEVIGESFFYAMFVWALAGWMAWNSGILANPMRPSRWWLFLIPFALMVLTKPSGRFFWPGLIVSLIALQAWRFIDWTKGVVLILVCYASFTMGSEGQGAWLAYSTSFPLTRLDTPLHAEYKAEIRELVTRARERLHTYYFDEQEFKGFLKHPDRAEGYPLWNRLDRQNPGETRKDVVKRNAFRSKLYKELALEGIRHEPHLFFYISLQRVLASVNPSFFKETKLGPQAVASRFQPHYEELITKNPRLLRHLLGMRDDQEFPAFNDLRPILAPRPDSFGARFVPAFAAVFERVSTLITSTVPNAPISSFRPTLLGVWMILGLLLAFTPHYSRTLGVWILISFSYLGGVFLVGSANPRFFGVVWPAWILALGVPADLLLRWVFSFAAKRATPTGESQL